MTQSKMHSEVMDGPRADLFYVDGKSRINTRSLKKHLFHHQEEYTKFMHELKDG